jgi:hypothetical protein
MSTAPMSPGSSPSALRDRIERVHQELVAQKQGTDRSTALVAVVGIIVIVVSAVVYYYAYRQIGQLVNEPKTLVTATAGLVDEQLPALREQVEKQVRENAPQWAGQLSEELKKSLPNYSSQFVDYAVGQADNAFNEGTAMSDDQMKAVINKHKPQFQQLIRELKTNDMLPESSMRTLEQALEEEMGADMSAQSKQIMDSLMSAREKMARLKAGKDLKPDEMIERNMLLVARRMRAEADDPKVEGVTMASDQELFSKKPSTIAPPSTAAESKSPPAASKKPEEKKPENKKPENKKP